MKFRLDFVTNSSSSSFLTFDVKNTAFYEWLENLGIQLSTNKGRFEGDMTITLPSGATFNFYDIEDADLFPSVSSNSFPVWFLASLLFEIENCWPTRNLDDYSDFTLELVDILNNAGVIHFDKTDVEKWSQDELIMQLWKSLISLSHVDDKIEMECNAGFEGEINRLEYIVANNGYQLIIDSTFYEDDEDELDDYKTLAGKKVAIVGPFKNQSTEEICDFVTNAGGIFVSEINEDTDLLIFDSFSEKHPEIKAAKSYCIPVLSAQGLYNKYKDEDAPMMEDDGNMFEDAYNLTYEGGLYEFFHKYGIGNVIRTKQK